jgi:hypothetical protein
MSEQISMVDALVDPRLGSNEKLAKIYTNCLTE